MRHVSFLHLATPAPVWHFFSNFLPKTKSQRKRGNLQCGGWYHHSSEVREIRSKEALQIRILDLCDENELSLNALGARCGITQSTLNNIVNGRNNSITIQTVLRICRGLGMELQEFFDDDLFRDIEQEIY